MNTLKTGSLAYLDTFAGQIPCKVLSIAGDSTGNICTPSPKIMVKLTAAQGAYRKGEIIESNGFHVYPRANRIVRSYHYRINTQYQIIGDNAQ